MIRLGGSGLVLLCLILSLAFGCDSGRGGDNAGGGDGGNDDDGSLENADATWYGGVGALLIENCGTCHQDGGIAPFEMTYENAAEWSAMIKTETGARRMPPMPVNNDGSCRTFSNARWLTQDEIDYIAKWVDDGTPEGKATDLPEIPADLDLDDANLVLDTGADYTTDDGVTDDYRCFVVTPDLDHDVFMTEYQVIPGNPKIAHHLILYLIDESDTEWVATEDAKTEEPGYTCFGNAAPNTYAPVALWAPGSSHLRTPPGTGIRIPKGRTLVMQMHYNLAKGPGTDRTTIKLKTVDEVETEGRFIPLLDHEFSLEPGQELAMTTPGTSYEQGMFKVPDLPIPLTIHGVFPHMHQTGRTLKVMFSSNEGDECLVDVDRWDFSWQEGWWYDEPFEMPSSSGRQFSITCGFDTSDRNENVTWGEKTTDEMCLNYLFVTSPYLSSLP